MATESFLEEVNMALFNPHNASQRHLHQDLLVWLAAVNILTITVTFLIAPAL